MFPPDGLRLLVVDDDERDAQLIQHLIESSDLDDVDIDWRRRATDGIQAVKDGAYSLCLCDFHLGLESGLQFVTAIQQMAPHIPVILLTGDVSRDVDMAAMNAGAVDFMHKNDLRADKLERAIRYAIEGAKRRASLECMARRDPLTGLHNRTSIEERLTQALHRAERQKQVMAVMMLDLDGFKAVNDTLGHEAGDQLLVTVAERLKSALRGYDAIGRIGGDEFVAVVEDLVNSSEAQYVADRLVRSMQRPFDLPGHVPAVTASVGYVCFPGPATSPQALLACADRAMYTAKDSGKGHAQRYRDDPEAGRSVVGLESPTPSIEDFSLVFQPQVDLRGGRTASFECKSDCRLVGTTDRCRSPRSSNRRAGSGTADAELELHLVSRVAELRRRYAPDVPCTIQLSAAALICGDFVARLSDQLRQDIKNFEFGISDTATELDRLDVQDALHALQRSGARVSLHDFGAGHGSLGRLRDLPIDSLKIDRTFVRNLAHRQEDVAIVEAIATLAERMDLRVIADGVENAEQAEKLVSLPVHFGQGGFFGSAMPAEHLTAWLATSPDQINETTAADHVAKHRFMKTLLPSSP